MNTESMTEYDKLSAKLNHLYRIMWFRLGVIIGITIFAICGKGFEASLQYYVLWAFYMIMVGFTISDYLNTREIQDSIKEVSGRRSKEMI